MREQLASVLEAARTPHIEVQVMPFAAGAHSAMGGLAHPPVVRQRAGRGLPGGGPLG